MKAGIHGGFERAAPTSNERTLDPLLMALWNRLREVGRFTSSGGLTIHWDQYQRIAKEIQPQSPAETTAPTSEQQALGELWDLLELSEEDAQTGAVSLDAAAWKSTLCVFWRVDPRYRDALENLGWSPLKTEVPRERDGVFDGYGETKP